MKTDSLVQFILVAGLLICSFAVAAIFAHEAHNKNTSNIVANVNSNANSVDQAPAAATAAPRANPTEFPTLHPLIVHFPIMLIILAAVLQLTSFGVFRKEFGWLVLSFSLVGAVTAWLSSNTFHPHTSGLNENAQRLLLEHEQYASLTFWFAAAGFVVKALSNFIFNRAWWSETVATLLLVGAAVAVAVAGHHGAELVHKEGVGPRGDFLETHDH